MQNRNNNYIFFNPNILLNQYEQKIVSHYFKQNINIFDWKRGVHLYDYQGEKYKIYLTHDVKKRYRKEGKNQQEFRYSLYHFKDGNVLESKCEARYDEFGTTGYTQLDNAIYNMDWHAEKESLKKIHGLIGYGGFGTVLPVAATMIINNDNTINMKPYGMTREGKEPKKRVIKVQTSDLDIVMPGYDIAKRFHHLKIKKPVIDYGKNIVTGSQASHTVMNEFPGEDLENILKDEESGKIRLSLNNRKFITYHLILALKTQIDIYGVTHRDIKPENIRINLKNNTNPITIFDYDCSIEQNKYSDELIGTLGYVPPECFSSTNSPINFKIDIFAMGRVLSKLWGISQNDFERYLDPSKPNQTISFDFFHGKQFKKLSIEDKKNIKELIKNMVHTDVNKRKDINQLLTIVEQLVKNHIQEIKNSRHCANSIFSTKNHNRKKNRKPVNDNVLLYN